MILKSIIFFTLFSSFPIFAQDGSTMKTIDTINGVKKLNPSDINHCSPVKNSMSTYHRKREGFEGKVSCRIKCRNGIERSVSMNHTFTNEAMELDTGDGNLHASFNITLDLWPIQFVYI